jgi:hypothetical protein
MEGWNLNPNSAIVSIIGSVIITIIIISSPGAFLLKIFKISKFEPKHFLISLLLGSAIWYIFFEVAKSAIEYYKIDLSFSIGIFLVIIIIVPALVMGTFSIIMFLYYILKDIFGKTSN